MALTVKQFQRLKQEMEDRQRVCDRAAGALEQIEQRLKAEFNCSTVAEAKQKLKELEQEEAKLERRFTKALKLFDQELMSHEREEDQEEDE